MLKQHNLKWHTLRGMLFLVLIMKGSVALAFFLSDGTAYDKDCQVARSFAVKNALENFTMQEFEAAQKQTCKEQKNKIDCSYERELSSEVAGTLKRIIREQSSTKDGLCYVKVLVEIEKTKTFNVDVSGKQRYLSGEELQVSFKTLEPLYVYVFNDHYTEFQKLYPLENDHHLLNGTFHLNSFKQARFQVYVKHPDQKSNDSLVVIFSKLKLSFKNDLTKTEFEDIIKSVPPYSRKVVYYHYVINRR